jgi:16S rRNA (cytosine967-C5)-methyltransferase
VVARFLDKQSDATLSPIDAIWGEPAACGRQLLPSPSGPDGLFYSLLRKTG